MKQIAVAAIFFLATNGLCQSPAKEDSALQSLMLEVHQLRMDIEAMTVASQRVQIALYKLQIQDAAVARTIQRVDSLHDRCMRDENTRQHTAADLQAFENILGSMSSEEREVKQVQSRVAELKSTLDTQTAEAQACQNTETEASGQLQKEQGKLAEMQEQMEQLDRTLEKSGGARQ